MYTDSTPPFRLFESQKTYYTFLLFVINFPHLMEKVKNEAFTLELTLMTTRYAFLMFWFLFKTKIVSGYAVRGYFINKNHP